MTEKVIQLLKDKNMVISRTLFSYYKDLGMTGEEFLFLIYLLNLEDTHFNVRGISLGMKLDMKDVLKLVNTLVEKDLLQIQVQKDNAVCSEVILFDGLYRKLALLIINQKEKDNHNLFDIFEHEFGRTISPMEYEIINAWKDDGAFTDELIVLALKEATYNGVSNLRYIDKILHEWKKKGIHNKDDVEKEKQHFNKKKEDVPEIIDYDWLNEHE